MSNTNEIVSEMMNRPETAGNNSLKKKRLSTGLALAVILLFGLIIRVFYLHEIIKGPTFYHPQIDAAYHDFWARGLSTGIWAVPEDMNDPKIRSNPYFRPPGYPLFLALVYSLTGGSYLAARIFQMALGLLNCVLAYFLARALFGRATGLIFAGFMAVNSSLIYFEGELLAPVLLVTFTLLLMHVLRLCYDRLTPSRAIVGGILLGLIALVRPNALIFVPVILGWIWWGVGPRNKQRSVWIPALGFILGAGTVIAPAAVRNYSVARDFVLITSNFGINLYIGNNEKSDGVSPIVPILKTMTEIDDWTCFDYPIIVQGIARLKGGEMKYSEVSSYFTDRAMDYILEHPMRILRLMAIKTALFWGPVEVSNNKEVYYEKRNSKILRYLPGFPMALSFALFGLIQIVLGWKAGSEKKDAIALVSRMQFLISMLVLFLTVTYFISFLPFFVAERFRVMILPFLFLLGAYGLTSFGRKAASHGFYGVILFGIILAGLYVAASRPFAFYEPSLSKWHLLRGIGYNRSEKFDLAVKEFREVIRIKENHWEAHNGLARALLSLGHTSEAIRHCSKALGLKPDYVQAYVNLGNALRSQGKTSEAIGSYIRALRINPEYDNAHINLGVVLAGQGRTNEAISHFYEALRIRPENPEAHSNLGLALVSQGNITEAIRHCSEALHLRPKYAEAHNNLGIAFAHQRRFKQAVRQFSEALRIKPDFVGARRNLERCLRLMNKSFNRPNAVLRP